MHLKTFRKNIFIFHDSDGYPDPLKETTIIALEQTE